MTESLSGPDGSTMRHPLSSLSSLSSSCKHFVCISLLFELIQEQPAAFHLPREEEEEQGEEGGSTPSLTHKQQRSPREAPQIENEL